ncbi:MaoC/PaaZ C-terminal domain-containing protein [Streptomyces sp. NBC_01314]|uniref:MaoC/PaaZ C-terminal domain-containing protein n=1 Tax=Streptomyces sp. NBC_01314 TaxID=2903821 RepID=UPI00308DBB8B|nr:MaoC/PaaZ C-terminal domain-containing protein [Streptomyces sp. NBC_01314]
MRPMHTLTLTDRPALSPLLARGALLSPCKSLKLPRVAARYAADADTGRDSGAASRSTSPGRFARLVLPGVRIDLARLAAYERVCGFPTGEDAVPLTYPHVLGFPLAMRIMAGRDFPLPLLGLVHTSIEITRRRRLPATGEYEITVYVDQLAPHRRGTEATVVTEVRDGAEDAGGVAWESRSTYLARHRRSEDSRARRGEDAHPGGGEDPHPGRSEDARAGGSEDPRADGSERTREERKPLPAVAEWRLAGDVGRRYGAVSGDRNPIHLHPFGARLFGFPRAIAHGMWTVARCLAEHGTPPATLVRAEFRAPVPLPGAVTYAADGEAWGGFELRSGDAPGPGGERVRPRVHVKGHVYPLVA